MIIRAAASLSLILLAASHHYHNYTHTTLKYEGIDTLDYCDIKALHFSRLTANTGEKGSGELSIFTKKTLQRLHSQIIMCIKSDVRHGFESSLQIRINELRP